MLKLDRSLTFRHHLVALRKKLSSRVTLLRRLVGSGWGAGAKTLRTATLSLVYSTAEYCAPVWCRSAHTRLIDSVLNDALRIVTGCLRPTPTDHLPLLPDLESTVLNGQTTNGKRSIVKMLPDFVIVCPGPVSGLLGWAYPEQLGLGSTACGLVLGDSIRPCTNGVSLLHRIASVAPLSKPQTMY